jgi:hypothetical protein
LDEVFNGFDSLYKQLFVKQKNGEFREKKRILLNIEQVVSEEEMKKVFNVLLSIKQKPILNETSVAY